MEKLVTFRRDCHFSKERNFVPSCPATHGTIWGAVKNIIENRVLRVSNYFFFFKVPQFIENKNKESSAREQNAKRALRTDVDGLSDIDWSPAHELCARL